MAEETSVRWSIDSRKLQRKLHDTSDRLRDLSTPLEEYGEWFREQVRQQFDSQGSHFNCPWAPTKRPNRTGKILQDTGRMMHSFTEKNAQGNISRVYRQTAVFGSSVRYAQYHQQGTDTMVARPILPKPEFLAPEMARRIATYVMSGKSSGE